MEPEKTVKLPSASPQEMEKTIVMPDPAAPVTAQILPEELLSARRPPHPLIAFLAETLESFSQTRTHSFAPPEENCNTPLRPDPDPQKNCCKDPEQNYTLAQKIAGGGQGDIHRAWDTQFQRTVAVKSLLPEKLHSPVRQAFFHEAQITAQLQHPGIVPIHSMWVDGGDCPHLAMKLVEGLTLRDQLDRLRKQYDPLPWRKIAVRERLQLKERLEMFLKICDTLAYAHDRQVIHRDLKPENIMLGRFGEVYVLDWGLTVSLQESTGLIESGVCGTPRYIAPEVLNRRPYGKKADIYQMGLILFELVYLRRAYPLTDPAAALSAGMDGHTAPAEHLYGCRVPPLLQSIIAKATAFRQEERYADIAHLARDIRAFLNQAPVSVEKHPLWSAFTRLLMRNSQKLLAVIALLTLLIFGMISWELARSLHEERQMELKESVLRNIYATYLRNVLFVERRFFEIDGMLLQLASEAAARLEKLPPPDPAMRFYDHRAWRSPETAPPGFRHSGNHDFKVSFQVPLYKVSQTPIPDLRSYLTALSPMTRSCNKVILWNALHGPGGAGPEPGKTPISAVYIGLDNGLFMTFPYSGRYPDDFDPRQRPWYRKVLQMPASGKIFWSDPYYDPGMHRTVISASTPVRDRQENIIAVLGLDLEPATMIRAFMQSDAGDQHICGRYLLNKDGRILASDRDLGSDARAGLQLPFPHMQLFPEIRKLKTGRLFLDEEESQLVIFHYIKALNCYFAEIIDFGRILEELDDAGA